MPGGTLLRGRRYYILVTKRVSTKKVTSLGLFIVDLGIMVN